MSKLPRLTRRQTLQLAGAGMMAGAAAAPAAAGLADATRGGTPGGEAVRCLLVQRGWEAGDPARTLAPLLARLDPGFAAERHRLLLLPQAAAASGAPPPRARVLASLGTLASRHRCWIAGAATLGEAGAARTLAFLVDPGGLARLLVAKVTPDLANGFADATATLAVPRRFETASTPFGRVGLLPGEDLLMPGLVRATVYAGAELILAPFSAAPPGTAAAVQELPTSIGYENWCAVALASRDGGARYGDLTLDAVAGEPGVDWVAARFDPQVVRHARAKVSPDLYDNFPLWVRDELFGRMFEHQAAARGPVASPASRDGWRAEAARRVAAREARRTPPDLLLDSWLGLIVQPATMASLPADGRRAALAQNVDAAIAQVGRLAAAPNAKIALFPEFCFSGAGYRTVPDLLSASVDAAGPEVAKLRQWARDNSIYAAAEFLEIDPAFPQRAFNSALLIDDRGELILTHRKLQCVDVYGALPDTTPGSVYDAYVAKYGVDHLYRIVDTPLGRIGVIICFEIVFPEVSRALANAGVEVILHLTAEGYSSYRSAWHALRRKRAFENQAYLLCSNKAYDLARREPWVSYGESQFIDFRGRERDRLAGNGPAVLIAPVDMASLRAARRDLRLNTAIWDEPGAYAGAYLQGLGIANNGWRGDPMQNPYARVGERVTGLADVQQRFYERGTYLKPA
jgi:predicted amidohydrolase